MKNVTASIESRPTTPNICQGQSKRILKTISLPLSGAYGYANPLKIVIYDVCGH